MTPEMMLYMAQAPQASHQGGPEDVVSNPSMNSPFNAGSLAAIKAAKQSLGMDEEEKRRAMGLAIAKFFSGMAKPGYGEGLGGALGAAASNVAPALEAYQGEENRALGMNAALMSQYQNQQLQQQKMQQAAVERALKNAHLMSKQQETERHHRTMEGRQHQLLKLKEMNSGAKSTKLQKELEKQDRIDKLMAEGEIPIDTLSPSARSDLEKKYNKSNEDIPINKRASNSLDKLDAIFKEYPDIGESLLQTLETSPLKRPGFFTQLIRKFGDKKKISAIQTASKLINDLNLQTILDAPSKTASNLFKEQVAKSGASEILTYDAYKNISKGMREKINSNLDKANIYRNSIKRGVVPDFAQVSIGSKSDDLSSSSTEDLLKQLQALKE